MKGIMGLTVILAMAAILAPGANANSGHGNQDLPLAARYAMSAALGRDNPAYHFSEDKEGLRGRNPAQSCDIGFSDQGVELGAGARQWGLSLSGWGYGQDLSPVARAVPRALGNRVEYRRGPLIEWYVNGPLGLQQGFTLESRPEGGRPEAELRLSLDLAGGLTAIVDPDRRGASLQRDNGQALARYDGLTVLDVRGREATAWLEVEAGRLSIVVDDRDLDYPLVIDPFIQKAKLTASDGAANDQFGYTVSVSGDTVVVGAPFDDDNGVDSGSAYVFVKSTGGWADMTQTAKLTASDYSVNDYFGYSVSVSGDTLVVGAVGADGNGSVYVFVKPVAGWADMTQTAKLTATDGAPDDYLGYSVSIDGDTVVGGAPLDDDNGSSSGSAYVFVKPVAGWTDMTQAAKLTATDGAMSDWFGNSVSISSDTVVVGAKKNDDNGEDSGSAYVFVKPVAGWTDMTQAAKLTATDGAMSDWFGNSVSISGDTVVVGAERNDDNGEDSGSAYVFVKPGGGWVDLTQTAKLTASDGAAEDRLGYSVSIDGDTVVAGALGDNSYQGSAYVFVRSAGGWANMTQTAKLTASDGAASDQFGHSVSIEGDMVVVATNGDDESVIHSHSAYVFETRNKAGRSFLNLLLLD